jgi:two-component system cell cycle response regulator
VIDPAVQVIVAHPDHRRGSVLSWLMHEQGYRARVACDRAEFAAALRAYHRAPDLVLADSRCACGDDAWVPELRQDDRWRNVRVLATAPAGMATADVHALADVVDDFVVEPLRTRELLEHVRLQIRAGDQLRAALALAATDALTLVLNRRALLERLTAEVDRARRFGSPLSLLLLDVDYFKQINDTAGHLAGDRVLRQLGTLLQEAVRTVDVVARYGGEEFVVILPETLGDGGLVFAERLRERIAAHVFDVGVGDPTLQRLTVSIGMATFRDDASLTAERLFAAADEALYRAKSAGRNRVCQ